MMKNKIRFALIFLTVLGWTFVSISQQKTKPNIIFILTDDQRWDAIGYAGNKLIHTPEMDKLAKEGVYFKNSVVTTPICAASRASLLSGMHERAHRFSFQTGNIRKEFMKDSYPKILKNAGYYTGFFGKLGVKTDQKEQLFNEFDDYDRNVAYPDRRGYFYKTIGKDTVHLTRYTGHQALNFINQAPTDKPFCLSLSFSAPHAHDNAPDQYFWQKETDQLLQNTTIPPADIAEDSFFNILPDFVKKGFNRLRWTWRFDTPEKYQHSLKGYYRMISGIDLEIAKIRKTLKEKGIEKNTIIILMGDNGYFLGERQLAGKWLLYDNSIRVPLIIYDPRKPFHKDATEIALNIDVPATILDFAGVKNPKTWQGKSLRPILAQQKTAWNRDTVLIEHLWEFDNIPPSEGLKTKDWKYFRYVNDKSVEELYDLKSDPKEINNLAFAAKFKNKLIEFRKKTDALIQRNLGPISIVPINLGMQNARVKSQIKTMDDTPKFSWQIPRLANSQSGYQILVASSLENINNNIGDQWNTGEVKKNRQNDISYTGSSALKPNQKYYWKVRIWDNLNRTSEYSKFQIF